MMDNLFTTLQNEPPYVLEGVLVRLPEGKKGFTSGNGVGGDIRNEVYIVSSTGSRPRSFKRSRLFFFFAQDGQADNEEPFVLRCFA